MTQGLKIGAGWNVALGSLTDIATISVSGIKFADPKTQYFYGHGQRTIRADGSVYDSGYPYITWRFGIMTFAQYPYAQSTWCSGGWSGQVTIYCPLNDPSSFQRMNAVLIVPQQTELRAHLGWYIDVPFMFTRLVAAS